MKKNVLVLVLAALVLGASAAHAIKLLPRPYVEQVKFATYPNGVQTTLTDTAFSAGIGKTLYTDVVACTSAVIDMRNKCWAPSGSNTAADGVAAFLVGRCSFLYADTVLWAVESSPDGRTWEKETDTDGRFHPITGNVATAYSLSATDGYNFIIPIETDFDATAISRSARYMSPFIRVLIKPGLTAQVLAGTRLYLHYFAYDPTDAPVIRRPRYQVKQIHWTRAISTGTADSLEVLMTGCSVSDTSAAISTADFSVFPACGGKTDVWSMSGLKFWVTSPTVTATDTISVGLQGSYNGTDWVGLYDPGNYFTAGQAGVNNNVYVYTPYASALTPAMAAKQDVLMWPYLRAIVSSDANNSCKMLSVKLYCGAWRTF